MEPNRRTLSDAADLKALAHPLRLDLLEILVLRGPRTATQLAAELGGSPSNCSWHLRKLAEHGFVTEVAGATGRQRPWQAVSEGLRWAEGEDDEPETSAAGHALTDMMLTRELQRLRVAQETERFEPPEWREASNVVQSALWLTAEEAKQVSTQLQDLLMTHFDRLHHPERRPEGARLVSVVGWLVPRPEQPGGPRPTSTENDDQDEESR
ncbi:MAG TPA: helix-turn-helix domain-containing protein [Nocardioidaceae bacterium]|nr:helix-turn-helix domain-containing protein [Nocardioidaceae bacterium]